MNACLPDFSHRSHAEELMDLPDCDARQLIRTVDQFATINRMFSRYRGLLRDTVLRDMQRDPTRTYHLADLGAGGCDIPVWLLSQARRMGLQLRVTAVDGDARIVAHARNQYGQVPGLTIREGNALDLHALKPVDYLFANHFLHHLQDDQVIALLQDAVRFVQRGVLLSDLHRQPIAYVSYDLLTRICFRDSFAREDGKLSILKGFTVTELQALVAQAALEDALQVQTRFPGRIVLTSFGRKHAGATSGRIVHGRASRQSRSDRRSVEMGSDAEPQRPQHTPNPSLPAT